MTISKLEYCSDVNKTYATVDTPQFSQRLFVSGKVSRDQFKAYAEAWANLRYEKEENRDSTTLQ